MGAVWCNIQYHYASLMLFATRTHTHTQARGIDIPLLDNVINYNFPAKSKLFVHRVGKSHMVAIPAHSPHIVTTHGQCNLPVLIMNFYSGRVARAGRSGVAYSLVSSDEVAYMLDLHLFLGQTLRLHHASGNSTSSGDEQWPSGRFVQVTTFFPIQ